jgi:hypothetical protein
MKPNLRDSSTARRAQVVYAGVLAAYDRRVVVARMAVGYERKARAQPQSRAQGGRLPHGYRRTRSGGVEVDLGAAAEVVRVFALIRDGKSVRKAAEVMTAETGRKWTPATVARMVAREDYKRGSVVEKPARAQHGNRAATSPRLWRSTSSPTRQRARTRAESFVPGSGANRLVTSGWRDSAFSGSHAAAATPTTPSTTTSPVGVATRPYAGSQAPDERQSGCGRVSMRHQGTGYRISLKGTAGHPPPPLGAARRADSLRRCTASRETRHLVR